MIPPKGFKAEIYPLRHKFMYSCGLSILQASNNSTMFTLAKNYKQAVKPDTITVNPHNANFDVETGAICNPMSILDKMVISMHFTLTEDSITDGIKSAKVMYMPIFTSFDGRLDSTDTVTTTTAAALLELTKDATAEDVTPAFATNLNVDAGTSDRDHPVSTVNFTEVFGTLNLSADLLMEGVPWIHDTFLKGLKYYTNKGALRSMIGRARWLTLTDNHPSKTVYIKKHVPRDVRRIQPYSFFGMLIHVPIQNDFSQYFYSGATTTAKPNVGVKALITYDEWHPDHIQEMSTT